MTDFVERLPWRLAALAGLIVGAVSLIVGTDLWVCLLRVGVAFVVFACLGTALRALLRHGAAPPASAKPPESPHAADGTQTGSHVDETTPEMTVDDL